VGKTTCAAAAAIAAAERGRRVLVVSTDPAHSLGDALTHRLAARPVRVPTRRGELYAVELNADRALERWLRMRHERLRTIVARGTYLDDEDIERFLRLSFPGVDELIGLVELARLAGERPYDDVVVDTAPTGHTLRLLAMPATLGRIAVVLDDMQAKHRYLTASLGGASRVDDAERCIAEITEQSRELQALLRDPQRCAFAWVLLPEPLSLEEARDGLAALETWGIPVTELIVNRVAPHGGRGCALCAARFRGQGATLAAIRRTHPGCRIRLLPELDAEPRGRRALQRLCRQLTVPNGRRASPRLSLPLAAASTPGIARRSSVGRQPSDTRWLDRLAPSGLRLLLVAGKGGVGKTSCAAALALALAQRGGNILLLSTDPAPSLGDVLGTPVGDTLQAIPGVSGLHARELDADQIFAAKRDRYRQAVDEVFTALRGGSRFDVAFDRTVVQDLIDLAPPGLDEVLGTLGVLEALSEQAKPGYDTVVLDTPPTGHALRLLQMPRNALEWVHTLLSILLKYRAVTGLGALGADLLAMARDIKGLLALLADRAATRVVVVTRAAELPRLETRRLLAGLRRLGLPPAAVLVNALTPPGCARCRRAAAVEARALAGLRRDGRSPAVDRCAIIRAPAVAPPPSGHAALARWRAQWELDGEAD
jgi:arsenite/tail-anchored protein-transporting ATPase